MSQNNKKTKIQQQQEGIKHPQEEVKSRLHQPLHHCCWDDDTSGTT
jgi:hypothetical protein